MSEAPKSNAEQRVLDGTAWNQFCDTLKAAGSIVSEEGSPTSAFDRAEGYRYLSRLVRGGLETFLENADPRAPQLVRNAHETIKMGADNPDNCYQSAPINGKYDYRILGTRGTVHYLGFGTQKGNYGATGALEPSGYIDASELELAGDGSFELTLSCRRHEGNWLPMEPDTRIVIVRQTFLDKAGESPADLVIERIDGEHTPRALDAENLDRGLTAASRFVFGCARIFQDWSTGFREHTNQLPMFDPEIASKAGGVPDLIYYHSYWELAEDEALVIEVTPPRCEYWNFQLNNHWMESLDYRYFPVSVNQHTARLGDDGSVRIVVAHQNPGADNWIDTCGHSLGTMCLRWFRADEHPVPITRVVKTAELCC